MADIAIEAQITDSPSQFLLSVQDLFTGEFVYEAMCARKQQQSGNFAEVKLTVEEVAAQWREYVRERVNEMGQFIRQARINRASVDADTFVRKIMPESVNKPAVDRPRV